MSNDFEIFRVLAQSRPSGTGNVTAYTKPTTSLVTIDSIVVCNTTNAAVNFRLFVCTTGTTYDQTTALAYDVAIAANDTQIFDISITLVSSGGTIGVQSGTGSAINFTIIGKLKEFN